MKGIQYNYIENNNTNIKTELIIAGGMIAVTLVSAAVLSSVRVNADTDAVDEVSITVPNACTMSGNIATGNEHTASINPNTYQDNIGKTTITAYCNDSGGYAIYAIGYTSDEYTGEDHTKLIGTNTNQKISTGTAKTGTSQWAMRITPVTGTYAPTIENNYDSEDYHIVPDTYEKVATYGNTTDAEGGTGSSIETTYAAYISGTQSADTYTGKVKYTLVHPSTEAPSQPQSCTAGKICYFANVSDYEGTMAEQDIVKEKDWSSCEYTNHESYCYDSDYNEIDINTLPELDLHIAPLLASNFSRTGYGFAGWSDKFDYATNPEAKFYGPNETITLNTADYTGTNPGLSLYAVWVKSQGNLQDPTKVASVCSSLDPAPIDGTANLSSVSALTDQRDNNTYAIAKLADGKCWMIENLRLADKDGNNNDVELSATNTNSPSLPLTNIYDATNPTTSNHLSASITPSSSTPWCRTNSASCDDQSMLYTGNTTKRGTNPAASANTYSYGNYYNWYSATAGNGKYDNVSGYTAPGDICPKGWTLPTSGSASMNFGLLDVALGGTGSTSNSSTTPTGAVMSAAYRSYPNNFLYSGSVNGSSVDGRGSYGFYWSKSAGGSYYAYLLYFYSSYVSPSDRISKNYGSSVRCLAQ